VDTFLAFLEYLYSDHAPIEDGDSVGLLQLADSYCVPRLVNLCELYTTMEVDRSVSKNIEKSDIDVIGLLLVSQVRAILLLSYTPGPDNVCIVLKCSMCSYFG